MWLTEAIYPTPVGAAVYTTVLTNTVTKYTMRYVPPAVEAAGLSPSKVKALLGVVGTPALATSGYPPAIVAAAGAAVQQAYQKGVQNVAFTSLAFGIIGIIACALCKDVDSKMDNRIEVYLENTDFADRNKYH